MKPSLFESKRTKEHFQTRSRNYILIFTARITVASSMSQSAKCNYRALLTIRNGNTPSDLAHSALFLINI